jgi:hypothetical protein
MEHNRSLKRLEKINSVINWSQVEEILMAHYTVGTSREGADAYPPLMLLKGLLLEKWYRIDSDPELEWRTEQTFPPHERHRRRQGHTCHEKNVQQQLHVSKTLSHRSRRPKVYRQSDPTGVRRKQEGSQIECSSPNHRESFSPFPAIRRQTSDPVKKSPASTAEGLPVSSKTAPGTEPLSS